MKIFITGGTGFVGRHLTSRLIGEGHTVTVLSRSEKASDRLPDGIYIVQGDPTVGGTWQESLKGQDCIINLAGASLFTRWKPDTKRLIRESRISTTRNIVDAIESARTRDVVLFSTSAVGYYGFRGDEALTEESTPGDDFLARVAIEWEKEALRAEEKGTRVVITRFGIVLGEKEGALGQMMSIFRKYLGGPLGSGKQWFSWIHMGDLVGAFLFLMAHREISGPVNLTSPNPVRNEELARALGKAMHRPSLLPAPGFMLQLILGEFGSVLLEGQRVIPQKLVDNGYVFIYPEIDGALQSLIMD
ncbi:MAG: TIGR01777 family oxidoreductase [Syntrophobacterales bacterium]|nr:MAG: TIGR01777 family oxidoreductase [Syntrophobacterales bacterium]